MNELGSFLNRHQGETAWLFGKGPSFSSFDFAEAGNLRVAINDVVAHVPDCTYCFSNDGVKAWLDVYKKGQILFQPKRCLHEFDSTLENAVDCDVVAYDDTYDDRRLAQGQEALAYLPTIRRGTLGSALQILHVMGIKTVHLVGIDGGGEHAQGYQWRTRLRSTHAKDYNAIRNAAITAADLMGITLKFHNQENIIMDNNGKIYVQFLRNSLAQGEPFSQGQIEAFPPNVANDLVTARAAEIWEIPEKESRIETPEDAMTAKESAIIPTKKAAKKAAKKSK